MFTFYIVQLTNLSIDILLPLYEMSISAVMHSDEINIFLFTKWNEISIFCYKLINLFKPQTDIFGLMHSWN